MAMPKAMRITVPEDDVLDLKNRLAKTRFPDQLEGVTWEYGTDITYLKVESPLACLALPEARLPP